ncbi:MAG: hypothetical protein GXP53_10870 [Deltaproteobacteria bacterium]|nr:hypothetical protein [Deltaproteobacteria bacterium]
MILSQTNKQAAECAPAYYPGCKYEDGMALKNVFLFLAILFRYPSGAVYDEITGKIKAFEGFFLKYAGKVPEVLPKEALQAEYITLFVNNLGFVPAYPYASAHIETDGLLMGDAWRRLREMMIISGMTMDRSSKELEDHISVLLEYCACLTNLLMAGIDARQSLQTDYLKTLIEVLERYIRPMTAKFTDGINDSASHDFYKLAGKALKGFVEDSDDFLDRTFAFENA